MKIRIAFLQNERQAAENVISKIRTLFPLLKVKEDKQNTDYSRKFRIAYK